MANEGKSVQRRLKKFTVRVAFVAESIDQVYQAMDDAVELWSESIEILPEHPVQTFGWSSCYGVVVENEWSE